MLHLCLKKLTPSFNQDCIHIRKCLMPSMREHYNTDGIRISTTAISFFLHHLPHANPTTCFGCFFYAFMAENWMTKMAENWEITDMLFLCFYGRKLEVWNEKKIGRLVTLQGGISHLSWIFLCPFFRNNVAHFSQFHFGLYRPICRIRLYFHHMF